MTRPTHTKPHGSKLGTRGIKLLLHINVYLRVPTKSEHDKFTKKVKDKVTILGAVFCRDKHLETFENLQKAYNALKKAKNNYSYGNFVSLVGKYCD